MKQGRLPVGEARRRFISSSGLAHEAVHDPDAERMVVRSSQDVEPVLEAVARERDNQQGHSQLGVKLGTLPAVIVVDLINRGIFYDPDAFDKWWNSSEANPWRIWKGSV